MHLIFLHPHSSVLEINCNRYRSRYHFALIARNLDVDYTMFLTRAVRGVACPLTVSPADLVAHLQVHIVGGGMKENVGSKTVEEQDTKESDSKI